MDYPSFPNIGIRKQVLRKLMKQVFNQQLEVTQASLLKKGQKKGKKAEFLPFFYSFSRNGSPEIV